ncbi:MAG: trigger factor [Oscillatoriophycideae cyanobacterium NC_groundwater_1537_Pr4_S-0.65um_50_18]|nr:trigger factor [Oscillatoriophycideae cyanobacterium NC_groundwater_1537_Pr4_S-0.65um_50_18]
MKVTQEKLPASQIGLEIEIPSEMSKQAYEKALKELTRFADIPGFRKGKVPRQVLIQRFGSLRIKATAVEDLIQDGIQKALEQEKIEAIGAPQLRSSFDELVVQFEPGTALKFQAAVDVAPEVKLSQYKGLEAKAEEVKYDPERVDQVLEDYRKRSSTLVPVEGRAAQADDVATIDFAGRLAEAAEGEEEPAEIPGGSAQDFEIELSEGGFIPGFIEGIIGMAAGETKDIAVTFPDPYAQEDLAGKPAVFTITLKDLKTRELPELDDDFAQDVSEFETLAELRASLEKRYQDEADAKTKSNKQEALLNELVKYLEAELPETLVKQEVDFSITQTAMRLSQQGLDIRKTFTNEIVSMLREQARPEAILRLQRTLALGEVAKTESIQVTPEEVATKVDEVLAEMSDQKDIDENRLRQAIEDDLLRDKILDWLEAEATLELVPEGSLKPAEEEVAIEEVLEADASEATLDVSAETIEETSTEPEATAAEAPEAEAPKAEAPEAKAAPVSPAPTKKGKSTKS